MARRFYTIKITVQVANLNPPGISLLAQSRHLIESEIEPARKQAHLPNISRLFNYLDCKLTMTSASATSLCPSVIARNSIAFYNTNEMGNPSTPRVFQISPYYLAIHRITINNAC